MQRAILTYVGLYGSGLFNFGSYVNLPTSFAETNYSLPCQSSETFRPYNYTAGWVWLPTDTDLEPD